MAGEVQARRAANRLHIADYIDRYGPDVSLVDLRGFMRTTTGCRMTSNQLVPLLRDMGYRRDGYRPIDTCPGKSLFYVADAS